MDYKNVLERNYSDQLLHLLHSGCSRQELTEQLGDYHDNDLAAVLSQLSAQERRELYGLLGTRWLAQVLSYTKDAGFYLQEMGPAHAAQVLSKMDADDAVDVLERLPENVRRQLITLLDDDSRQDVRTIYSYEEDEAGSVMTTNFVAVPRTLTIRQAMRELIRQAGDHDNIGTVYATENGRLYGAIDLKELITARENDSLESIISTSYPYVTDHEKLSDCAQRLREYAEDSIPVVNKEMHLLGVITSQDIVELVDDQMGDDYAKLGGLSNEEDLNESIGQSIRKRLPWLVVLLFLGLGVSSVVGAFEGIVAVLPIVMCFQSLILDMAGNVGTQSLAVTIRVLADKNLPAGQRRHLVGKEMEVGFGNGLLLGLLAFVFIGLYLCVLKHTPVTNAFLISGCVGLALVLSMVISSLVGTLIPMFFQALHVDPAVASGPLITTVNDLVAVVTYYSLVWLLLIRLLGLH